MVAFKQELAELCLNGLTLPLNYNHPRVLIPTQGVDRLKISALNSIVYVISISVGWFGRVERL